MVQASEYADVVAILGHEFMNYLGDSIKFPDIYYIYVDNEIEGIDNLITISYMENEVPF